jgi:hypothetical protein
MSQTITLRIQDSKALTGAKATEALDKYIRKIEKRKLKNLNEVQSRSLLKTARVLRTIIAQN